jgi:hypothetical protein
VRYIITMPIVSSDERNEIFCAIDDLMKSDVLPVELKKKLESLKNDESFKREINFNKIQPTDNNSKLGCLVRNIVDDPSAISWGLHTVANVGSLIAFLALYKKFNNRQKTNQILNFISDFATWGIYSHQLVRKNACSDC